MRLVRIPGRDVQYPPACACCLAPATTTIQIRKEDLAALAKAGALAAAGAAAAGRHRENRAVKVPHCGECVRHVLWKRSGGWLGVFLHVVVNGFFGLLLGFVADALASAAGWIEGDFGDPNWVVVGIFVAGGVAIALSTLRWRPSGRLGRNHARDGIGVEIARFSDSEIALRCFSDAFASKLVEANPGAALSRDR